MESAVRALAVRSILSSCRPRADWGRGGSHPDSPRSRDVPGWTGVGSRRARRLVEASAPCSPLPGPRVWRADRLPAVRSPLVCMQRPRGGRLGAGSHPGSPRCRPARCNRRGLRPRQLDEVVMPGISAPVFPGAWRPCPRTAGRRARDAHRSARPRRREGRHLPHLLVPPLGGRLRLPRVPAPAETRRG